MFYKKRNALHYSSHFIIRPKLFLFHKFVCMFACLLFGVCTREFQQSRLTMAKMIYVHGSQWPQFKGFFSIKNLTAITWLEYCQYGIKPKTINHSIYENFKGQEKNYFDCLLELCNPRFFFKINQWNIF